MSMGSWIARRYNYAQDDLQAWIDESRIADLAPSVRDAVAVGAVAWPLAVQKPFPQACAAWKLSPTWCSSCTPGEIACRRP